ncbi:MAG: XTP/dITP diphosphatase [PVC group bacterium]|nr:XTP/dITP diphosphatase [PVC group bacterium]
MEVVVSTRNKDKFREISEILEDSSIKTVSLEDFPDAPMVEEDGDTFADNAAKKALVLARFTKRFTVADDSGLEVDYLNGAPGVYSARFSGVGATYQSNNEKLLQSLEGVSEEQRKARFVCCVAIADEHGIVGIVEGESRGIIDTQQRGDNGFGYDPLFISFDYNRTFAELDPSEKNKISHRAKAFAKAKDVILKYIKENS